MSSKKTTDYLIKLFYCVPRLINFTKPTIIKRKPIKYTKYGTGIEYISVKLKLNSARRIKTPISTNTKSIIINIFNKYLELICFNKIFGSIKTSDYLFKGFLRLIKDSLVKSRKIKTHQIIISKIKPNRLNTHLKRSHQYQVKGKPILLRLKVINPITKVNIIPIKNDIIILFLIGLFIISPIYFCNKLFCFNIFGGFSNWS